MMRTLSAVLMLSAMVGCDDGKAKVESAVKKGNFSRFFRTPLPHREPVT